MREALVYGVFAGVVMLAFLLFVAFGWPGGIDRCVFENGAIENNSCWCEAFDLATIGAPGVQQKFNTWSNLMALIYGAIVAYAVWRTRTGWSGGDNKMVKVAIYPLTYIGVVLFLGLGSMWFHASITAFGGVFDQLSMFTFSGFILVYTIARVAPPGTPDWPFILLYLGIAGGMTAIAAATGIDSAILIALVMVPYVFFEAWLLIRSDWRSDPTGYFGFYVPALVSFGAAMLFWMLSQTNGPLCSPGSGFQFHGVWHWLAGITSVLLYFYWRRAPR